MNEIKNIFMKIRLETALAKAIRSISPALAAFVVLFFSAATLVAGAPEASAAGKLRVCATTTDLGDIAVAIGGGAVEVVTFAKGTEDPHFVEARPQFIKELSAADVLLLNGLELEIGWLPALLQNCRNGRVQTGATGYVDCSGAITPLDAPTGTIDRSMGDVHPDGNPHYLCDPVNGIRVARLVAEKFGELMPSEKDTFTRNFEAFKSEMAKALAGEKLAAKYDIEKLMKLQESGKLMSFLESQKDAQDLGGALKKLAAAGDLPIVDDHNMWPYLCARYRISCRGHMEAIPGVPPTTRNIGELAKKMKQENIKVILTSAYYDSKHAELLSKETGAAIAKMANLTGSRPEASTYIKMCEYNANELARAFEGRDGKK